MVRFLVKSVIFKDQRWKNHITKILPLHTSDFHTVKEKIDYGRVVLLEEIVSVDDLIELTKGLLENKISTIALKNYDVEVEGILQNKSDYDSGREYLNIEWSFEKYVYGKSQPGNIPYEPLISKDFPVFPDYYRATNEFIGVETTRFSDYGIIICLPKYGARIEKIDIGLKEVRIGIQAKDVDVKDIVGKLYCELDQKVKHADVLFQESVGTAVIGFKPSYMYVALVSKVNSELLDSRNYYSSVTSLPKGMTIEVPDYSLREMIKRGETGTVEFKEEKVKGENLAKVVVAFANTKGGEIFLGINDECEIVGLSEEYKDVEDKIAQTIGDNCIPSPEYEMERRQLDGKNILIIHVKEGKNKPYFLKGKIAYVRASSTSRIADKYELDEMYNQKQSGYSSSIWK